MSIDDYFGQSTGSFPASEAIGLESEWLHLGVLSIPCGDLWVGQFFPTNREDGCVVKVPTGFHEVWIKGMDFDGHRRTAGARVCLTGVHEPVRGERSGEIAVDAGAVALCDISAFEEVVLPQHAKQFRQEITAASMAAFFESYGIRCMCLTYAAKTIDVAFAPSGLGDGVYPVYPLLWQNRSVGVEVEFLCPNFRAPRGGQRFPTQPRRGQSRNAQSLRLTILPD